MTPPYFNRDLSWLAFNHRVLLEAEDTCLPLYERIKFLAIYANNLEEFYKVRVAEHRSILTLDTKEHTSKLVERSRSLLDEIHEEVTRQQQHFTKTFTQSILPELKENNIILSRCTNLAKEHLTYINKYFNEEVLPFLQPVMVKEGAIYTFLRDNRIYVSIKMYKKKDAEKLRPKYAAIKVPTAKISRFLQLPLLDDNHVIVFLEDIIKLNLKTVFPGYIIDQAFTIHISRDADLMIHDELDGDLVDKISQSLSKRKTGAPSRFVYEKGMPNELVKVIRHAFNIHRTDVVEGSYYLAMQQLFSLPNPKAPLLETEAMKTINLRHFDKNPSLFDTIKEKDILIHYPYHSYDYLIRFLMEASFDSSIDEIMVTQYRVASNSAVVNSLISAAQNGKKVTVFVELKARFDEENNLYFASEMQKAGVKIIYSIPNLKVHAKVALVTRKNKKGKAKTSFAYLSTGNFNEKTANVYSDFGLFTSNEEIIQDLKHLFMFLNDILYQPKFTKLLVAQFNLIPEINQLIDDEIKAAQEGKKAHITIKMNAIQDKTMIKKLYEASQAGVKIDMIIRGICCLIPGEEYSKNISITRIVDRYLEHTRIWHFHANGKDLLYMGSPDWMKRNLYRRIETVFPILDHEAKQQVIDFLTMQLRDNEKATWINNKLKDIPKEKNMPSIRSQYAMHDYWKKTYTLKDQ